MTYAFLFITIYNSNFDEHYLLLLNSTTNNYFYYEDSILWMRLYYQYIKWLIINNN